MATKKKKIQVTNELKTREELNQYLQPNYPKVVVIDGYHRKKEWIRRDQVRNNNSGVIQYRTIVEQVNTDYLAINWGYSGSGDSESGSTRWYYVCPEYQPDHIYWQRFSGTQTYTRVHSYIYGFSI